MNRRVFWGRTWRSLVTEVLLHGCGRELLARHCELLLLAKETLELLLGGAGGLERLLRRLLWLYLMIVELANGQRHDRLVGLDQCLGLLRLALLLLLVQIKNRLLLLVLLVCVVGQRLMLCLVLLMLMGRVGRRGLTCLKLLLQSGHVLSCSEMGGGWETRLVTAVLLLLRVLGCLRGLGSGGMMLVRSDGLLQILALDYLELLLCLKRRLLRRLLLRLNKCLRLLQPLVLSAELRRLQMGSVAGTGRLVVV